MPTSKAKRLRLTITIIVSLILIAGTAIAIRFAKGYRPSLKNRQVNGTGLLSATSYPKSAQVFIDDRLSTATDATLYLPPNTYTVKIIKEGFSPWTKSIPISSELVSATDARLFPSLPSISPLTYSGVENPTVSPDNTKIAFVVTNSHVQDDNGLYLLSLNSLSNNFLNNSQITQLTNMSSFDYSQAHLFWSPDSNQILAIFTNSNHQVASSHLLNIRNFNQNRDLIDTSIRLPLILSQWQEQITLANQTSFKLLPDYLAQIITDQAINVYFSPDQEKLLYTASKDLKLPPNPLQNTLPSINPTPEDRDLKTNATYVFDLQEGTNYYIQDSQPDYQFKKTLLLPPSSPQATASATVNKDQAKEKETILQSFTKLAAQTNPLLVNNLTWYSTSRHLFLVSPEQIQVTEYDNNNRTTIFQTNIDPSLALPSPDGHQLIILTNLNQKDSLLNFFAIDLK